MDKTEESTQKYQRKDDKNVVMFPELLNVYKS